MIVSFYDKNFKGLQNNASLVIDKDSYSLIKRPIEMNSLTCICEPFTENIQPTFLVIKDNIGNKIYSSLAGIPLLNSENKTEINGTDLKSMLSSDVILEPTTYTLVKDYIKYVFDEWKNQVNQDSFNVELDFKNYGTDSNPDYAGDMNIGDLKPSNDKAVYNAFDEIQAYLKFYNLYIDSDIDLVNKKVVFTIGKTMFRLMNIKLWEYGIKDYGKFIADVNECQGYYKNGTTWNTGYKWIMTSDGYIFVEQNGTDTIYNIITTLNSANSSDYNVKDNFYVGKTIYTIIEIEKNYKAYTYTNDNAFIQDITQNGYVQVGYYKLRLTQRDIYPIKRKVFVSEEDLTDANTQALTELLNNLYNEDITLNAVEQMPDYETKFAIYVNKGDKAPYKFLPCGELHYNSSGLTKFQIGYRFTGAEFI